MINPSTPSSLLMMDLYYYDSVYGTDGLNQIKAKTNLLADPLNTAEFNMDQELLAEVEVLFTGWGAPILNADFLSKAPKLKAVFYAAGATEYFLTDHVWERGIRVFTAIATNSEAVANYTIGAALFALKQGFAHATAAQSGRFTDHIVPRGTFDSKIGLISMGAIGQRVARKLRDFEMQVLGYDPALTPASADVLGVEYVESLEALFSSCDVVSLHTPLMESTVGMITGRHFEMMKPGATFINTARGAIVNEREMLAVLQERPNISAVLDVTDPEPPVAGSPLYQLPNVTLTPHIAGTIGDERRHLGQVMIAEFERWIRGEVTHCEIKKRE